MLRLHDRQATLWEQMLPDEIQLMGPELEAIDRLGLTGAGRLPNVRPWR